MRELPKELPMYDLIILGGGPAGLTAAVYAIRKRINALVISPDLGGKTGFHMYLPDNIDRFQVINGEEIVNRFKNQIEYLEFARKAEQGETVDVIQGGFVVKTKQGNRYEAKAVIVATGAGAVPLGVPGESKYRLRGLSYSAVSYAPLFIDRTAAVVGEGALGIRSALELAQNARHVYYLVSGLEELDNAMGRNLLSCKNVTVLDGYQVKEIKGDEAYAHSLVVTKGGEEKELAVDVTFVELGLKPNSGCVADLVELNEKKQIIIDSNNRTSHAGIFAAGDVTSTYAEQVLICIGEGAKAALSAYEFILSN
jgi:alkyl hydroperoxide reductase subunit F